MAHARRVSVEHRGGWVGPLLGLPERSQQAIGVAGPLEQLGGHDGAAQIVGPTGVDSAEQWVNKALEHRISHAGPDHLANAEVAVDSGAGGQFAIGPAVAG